MLTINIEKRDKSQKLKALRQAGKIPAVFYGRKEKSTPISVSSVEFLKVWKKAGESSIIELKGLGEDHEALIKEVDRDPVKEFPRHVDFYVIEKGKKLTLNIPIEFSGVSPAVKDLGGILVKVMHEIEIEAAPRDLPHSIIVDISKLTTLDSVISAKEISLPAGVELKIDGDDIVASIATPKEEVEETVPVDLSAIEVEKKGKEAKEGAEEATPAEEGK
jgi:large subunit ribosomal protein L25